MSRLDGREAVEVFYATFTTRTAGMPFMATVIAPLQPGYERERADDGTRTHDLLHGKQTL